MLGRLFHSMAKAKVFGIVLFQDGLHLREISRLAHVSPSETKKELDNLVSTGVLTKDKKGNQIFFYVNNDCSFLTDLKNLYLKTEGIFKQIKEKLSEVGGIEFAFIYGGTASGNFSPKGDIDVMVIGSVDEGKLTLKLFECQKKIKREINFVNWSEKDFLAKVKEKGSFIRSLVENKRLWLIGDKDGFERIVK
ncbi:MAG: nucleotidyltransferase domain-containing protein [archaeon]